MRYLFMIAGAMGLALMGCSDATTAQAAQDGKSVSCFDTGSGIKCFALNAEEAEDMTDVNGDDVADEFVCADVPDPSTPDAEPPADPPATDDPVVVNVVGLVEVSDPDADSSSESTSNSSSDTDCGVSESSESDSESSSSSSVSDLDGDGDGDGISDSTDCDCVLTE